MKKIFRQQKGFTLLYASLVVSLLLSIGLSISSLSLQQFLLSSSGKESQRAFYNADTGIECGLYYDHGKVSDVLFPTTETQQNSAIVGNQTISCAGQTSERPEPTASSTAIITTYEINPPSHCDINNDSFEIEVTKISLATPGTYKTIIRSRGYNTCDATNPRRVERGLQVIY